MKSKINFLNGSLSAGKTSIAKSIQHLSQEPWLILGMDTFLGAVPEKLIGFSGRAKPGFRFIAEPTTNQLVKVEVGSYTKLIFSLIPQVIKLFADSGLSIIVDEGGSQESLDNYKNLLSSHNLLMVGVSSSLEVMEEREILRGDRVLGTARIGKEKSFSYPYDLTVDTTSTSPFTNAKKILQFVEKRK